MKNAGDLVISCYGWGGAVNGVGGEWVGLFWGMGGLDF